jgi:hypothetical protein
MPTYPGGYYGNNMPPMHGGSDPSQGGLGQRENDPRDADRCVRGYPAPSHTPRLNVIHSRVLSGVD